MNLETCCSWPKIYDGFIIAELRSAENSNSDTWTPRSLGTMTAAGLKVLKLGPNASSWPRKSKNEDSKLMDKFLTIIFIYFKYRYFVVALQDLLLNRIWIKKRKLAWIFKNKWLRTWHCNKMTFLIGELKSKIEF